jgi:peptidoglycan/LPS O-acetylase OafA/YrhL
VFVLCGDASYGLHLLHSMVIGIYFHDSTGRLRHQSPIGVLVFVLLALIISVLVYRLEPARRKLNPRRKLQLDRVETQPPQPVPA